jgi:hypothetical protein
MRIKLSLIFIIFLALALVSGMAYAGDPLDPNDNQGGDWDNDGLDYEDEFLLGTDPYNADSDNDGLPDGWEYNYWPDLNPTDSTDAHQDEDGEDQGNFTGEKRAAFNEVRKSIDKWPSDGTTTVYEPVLHEQEPHYDNYEEYYRAYYDLNPPHGILYMHTNPLSPDTDGDGILDPDDAEPLSAANDGTCGSENCYEEPQPEIIKELQDLGEVDTSEISSWNTDSVVTDDYNEITISDKVILTDIDNDGL